MTQTIGRYPLSGFILRQPVREAIERLVPGWTPSYGVIILQSSEGAVYRFNAQGTGASYEVRIHQQDVENSDYDLWAHVEEMLLKAVAGE